MSGTPLPLPEETAQAFMRLATACFLSDLGIEAWCKLPRAARLSFAEAHGIALEVLPAVNQIIARYVVDDTQLQTAHRNAALGSLFAPDPALLEAMR
jgi:hypothetical protein